MYVSSHSRMAGPTAVGCMIELNWVSEWWLMRRGRNGSTHSVSPSFNHPGSLNDSSPIATLASSQFCLHTLCATVEWMCEWMSHLRPISSHSLASPDWTWWCWVGVLREGKKPIHPIEVNTKKREYKQNSQHAWREFLHTHCIMFHDVKHLPFFPIGWKPLTVQGGAKKIDLPPHHLPHTTYLPYLSYQSPTTQRPFSYQCQYSVPHESADCWDLHLVIACDSYCPPPCWDSIPIRISTRDHRRGKSGTNHYLQS